MDKNYLASFEEQENYLKRSVFLKSEVEIIFEEDDSTHENLTHDSQIDELYI